jgi:hypothetical protein
MAREDAMYTIRYRSALHPDSVRLIVEDASGEYHLFNCHPDHCSLNPMRGEDLRADSLTRLGWQPVPEAAPYPLDALRSLMTGALFTHHFPPALEPPASRPA